MPKVIVFGNTLFNTMGLIRSIGENGIPVILMLEPCRKSDCFVRFSRYVKKVHWLRKMEDALDVLRREYWDEPARPVILCGSVPLAERCGLNLIKTWRVKAGGEIPEDISYPCLIKGNNSTTSTKGDMHVCGNEEELRSNLHDGVDYLLQEYIERDYELDIVGLSINHGKDVYVPAAVRKIRDTLTRQSVYIRLDDITTYSSLQPEWIESLVREIGYEGIFSVEVLCRGDKHYFLEMNLRNDACCYLYTAGGVNYPLLWVLCNGGKKLAEQKAVIEVKAPVYLMHENDLYNLWEGKVSLREWLKDFWRSDAFFVMNWRDPLPFIVSTLIHFRQMCKKIVRGILAV